MNHELRIMNQGGQVIIILLLVMVVALAIGLSVVGRSITEISTSTNSENSSRAFSAAEAGIENVLYESSLNGLVGSGSTSIGNTKLTNNAEAQINWNTNMPPKVVAGVSDGALEYPPFGKESFAQFWLADPQSDPPTRSYTGDNFNLYFGDLDYKYSGNDDSNYPAVEVRVINSDNSSKSYFFDSRPSNTRSSFTKCSSGSYPVTTNNNIQPSLFLCKVSIPGSQPAFSNTGGNYPVMVRVRILYTETAHPVALQPTTGNLPYQAKIFDSKGTAGDVQRNIKVFQEESVMPHIFDYAIFTLSKPEKP